MTGSMRVERKPLKVRFPARPLTLTSPFASYSRRAIDRIFALSVAAAISCVGLVAAGIEASAIAPVFEPFAAGQVATWLALLAPSALLIAAAALWRRDQLKYLAVSAAADALRQVPMRPTPVVLTGATPGFRRITYRRREDATTFQAKTRRAEGTDRFRPLIIAKDGERAIALAVMGEGLTPVLLDETLQTLDLTLDERRAALETLRAR